MEHDLADLELSPETMRSMGDAVLERLVQHVQQLPEQPACGDLSDAAARCRAMREPAPEAGAELEQLLQPLFEEWIPRSFTSCGPGYLAYIPGSGLFPAALADLIQGVTNRYTGVWQAAPLLVQLEANVLDWFRGWMGLPDSTRGLLTTGGSMANFNAIACARERHLGPEIRSGTIYTSTQVHHSVLKAARLAGIGADRIRALPVDEHFRLRLPPLRAALQADRQAGLKPFLVVSSAGTTNTGAVDPLDELAELCAAERLWHHVDGAYGAFFHMCPELRPLLGGLSRADSLTLDPHKGLFLPFGTGALLVRDGEALRALHGATASYLPELPADDLYDPSQVSPDLSRGFPGLRVWLCVKLYGARRLRAAVAEKRALALEAADQLSRLPGVRLVAPPQLSLLAFHLHWPGASVQQQSQATGQLIERVRRKGRVMLTGCRPTADGPLLARVCVLGFRTHRDRVQAAVEDIAEQSAEILAQQGR